MKLAIWAIGSVFVLSGIVFWVMTHPNRDRANVMAGELAQLKNQNSTLAAKNATLARDVEALRNDPRVAARRAREIAPFAAPNETVYQLKRKEEPREIEVLVKMDEKGIRVAGSIVDAEGLEAALQNQQDVLGKASFKFEPKEGFDRDVLDGIQTVIDRANARTQ